VPDLDLRALSAPLEALQPEVKAAYTRLDAKWEAITEALRNVSVPASIGIKYLECEDGDYWTLEFIKWNGEKRLCDCYYTYDPNHDGFVRRSVTPYEEWSAETRIKMLDRVPALFKEAVKVTKEFIKKIPK
jgi:hypothetical protein